MDWRAVRRKLFPRRMVAPDVEEEIAFHIEERVRELVGRGWSDDEARRAVLARFGDVEELEAQCRAYARQRIERETRRTTMEGWARDFRFAARALRKAPGFTLAVVVTLALGIGATTAVFSVVEGILLRPLPFPEPDRLAVVWQNDRATGTVRENASVADYYDYLDRSRTFSDFAIYGLGTAVLTRADGLPLQLYAASVSANLAEVLGLEMQLGRTFSADEDQPGGPDVVVLTDRVWHDVFGGDPGVIGRSLGIDQRPHEVVGVLPPGIDYPDGQTDVWLPIKQSRAVATRQSHWVRVVGRMADGMTVAAAQDEMAGIMADLEAEYPEANQNRGALVERLSDVGRGELRPTLWILLGAVLAVLAIACVNVANLLLARGAGRMGELAVLEAVGADTGQISRRFFVEGLIVTLSAAGLGVVAASLGVRALTALAPASLTVLGDPGVNGPVLLFALAVASVICIGFGLLPTLQARRMDIQRQLKDGRAAGGGAGYLLRRFLVATQLSLAVVLLLGATLLIDTVRNLQSVDPGFVAESTLRADLPVPASRALDMSTYPDWPDVFALLRDLEGEVGALPGVRSAAVLLNHPLDPGFTNSFRIEGQPYDPSQGEMTTRMITPAYFETAGLEVLEGRALLASDRVGTPNVIVLNQAAAERYFPDGDALGQRIGFWGLTMREVVGIVANERLHGLTRATPPAMYVSMYQAPPRPGKVTLMVRTEVPPLTLVDAVRGAVGRVDASIPLFNVSTMEATLAEAMARERFASTVLSVFSAVALILAVLGVHGVLAYLVAQRRHEVSVRMTLGASRRDIVRMVLRQGASMTAGGVMIGLMAAVGLSGVLQSLLFGVRATDVWSYVLVGVAMSAVAMAATAWPAHRAASIEPASSLKGE